MVYLRLTRINLKIFTVALVGKYSTRRGSLALHLPSDTYSSTRTMHQFWWFEALYGHIMTNARRGQVERKCWMSALACQSRVSRATYSFGTAVDGTHTRRADESTHGSA
jgi:hypothetical protein